MPDTKYPCYFDRQTRCEALICRKCSGCKFRKSDYELADGKRHAEWLLERKGLEVYRNGDVVTVRERSGT